MKKMEKELMERKFEKLSDANKIRYNLENIKLDQMWIFFIILLLDLAIIGYILMLPFIIIYGDSNIIFLMVIVGVLAIVFVVIMFFVGTYKLDKSAKALGDFLNKKSKK